MSTAILRTAPLRAVEARALEGAVPPLMERAGAAAAEVARGILPAGGSVLVLAGPGNNGGDAFVVARRLAAAGYPVVAVFSGDDAKLPADAKAALAAWRQAGGTTLEAIPPQRFDLAVDGLFGIGLTRPLAGPHAALVEYLNRLDCPVLALDVPSGIDAETGRVMGIAVRASHTATFIALKPGLLTLDGPDHCGTISIHDLGLVFAETDGVLNETALFRHCLAPRTRNSHKGSVGSVGIVGGAPGMVGAALLAGRAALKLGAGRVYVGLLEPLAVDPAQPELMLRGAAEVGDLATALAIGPGLGQSTAALERLHAAIASPLPLVVDADGLNLLAAHPVLGKSLARREAATVLTPHPAEAARLLGLSTEALQGDRVAAALALAAHFHAHVVLKGCGSIVATPDGAWAINGTGNAGLASAGSGDVLTGLVVTLLAQGWPTHDALLAAVYLHGAAADALVAQGSGPVGLTAGELAGAARKLFNQWIADA